MALCMKGDRFTQEELVSAASSRITAMEKYEYQYSQGLVNAKAFPHEIVWFKRAMRHLVDGDLPEADVVRMLAALVYTVGNVVVPGTELGVHLGLYYTHHTGETEEGEIVPLPIAVCRRDTKSDWVDYQDILERLNNGRDEDDELDPMDNGYPIFKTDGAGYASCPGWTELYVSNGVPQEGRHHSCNNVVLASEAWHQWRCPDCHKALKKFRGTSRSKDTRDKAVLAARKVLRGKIRIRD